MGALPFPLLAACSPPRAFGQRLKLRAALRVCLVLGLVLTARFGDAQTLPVPTLPPAEPTPAEPPSPTPKASPPDSTGSPGTPPIQIEPTAPEPGPAWEYSVGVTAGYDTNVLFLPEGPADELFRPRAECTRTFRGTRSELRLGGSVDGLFYATLDNPNPGSAQISLSGRRALTPTADLTGDVGGGLGRTDANEVLTEQGILLPASRVRFPPCHRRDPVTAQPRGRRSVSRRRSAPMRLTLQNSSTARASGRP